MRGSGWCGSKSRKPMLALLAEKPEWLQERRRPPFLLLAAERPR